MDDTPLIPLLYLASLVSSAILYFRNPKSTLRAIIALLFLAGFVGPVLFSWAITIGSYDHGTAGEFLPTAWFLSIWALAVLTCSTLLARASPPVNAVLPLLFVTTTLLVMMFVISQLQHRFDFYHDARFFFEMYGSGDR